MPDRWEVNYYLYPLANDADNVADNDGLTNLTEYQNNSDPQKENSDADGMPDTWEIKHNLNPLIDDSNDDADNDGLTNLAEYQNKTNPNEKDTDADGMPDGWEVKYNLDPLVDDANLDSDGDTVTNLTEFIAGKNPNIKDSTNTAVLLGTENDDTFTKISSGNKVIKGAGGNDAVQYINSKKDVKQIGISSDFGTVIINFAGLENDYLESIERIAFENLDYLSLVELSNLSEITPLFSVSTPGELAYVLPTLYSGPVKGIQYQLLGKAKGDIVSGSISNDFLNLLGGDDAVNAGAGNDVIDGGTGSNFLTGGPGKDTYFVDGRDGSRTWSTITDWEIGEELSLWGWVPGTSTSSWADSAGAEGFKGATLNVDLDGDNIVDISVTWSGLTKKEIPEPSQFTGMQLLWFK
jgi:Ca2+-binding RTX toxin-like protein